MTDSILTSTKKNLGLDESYTAFDADIVMFINSTFSTLHQLGIGPDAGFAIEDATATWTSFIGTDKRYNQVKTYVYLCVRLLFDPPATSYLIKAMQDQKLEAEVRLSIVREGDSWVDPDPDPILEETILDGGPA